MTGQALALFSLQRTLTVRTWTRGKTIAAVLGLGMFLMACIGVAGMSLGLWLIGSQVLPERRGIEVLALLDLIVLAFIFLTFWGLLIDLQRNDLLDLRKLLHLPVPTGLIFTVNFLYSLLSPALLFFLPGSVALLAGMAHGLDSSAWLITPLAAVFFIMVSAWAYHLRGWLAILLQDRRRRRLFAVLLPVLAIVISQAPAIASFYMQDNDLDWRHVLDDPRMAGLLQQANFYFPPLWLPLGAQAVLAQDYARAAWCLAGMTSLTLLALLLGYRTTLRYCQGGGQGLPGVGGRRPGLARRPFTARWIPLLSNETATLTAAFMLDFSRHPAVRSQMIMPPLMTVLLCMGLMVRRNEFMQEWGHSATPMFVLLLPFLGSTMMFFNLFGTDVRGFRGLVLLPVARHRILLAKNLALFPFVAVQCLLVLGIASLMAGAQAETFALQLLHVPAAYALFCVLGNLLSVYAPLPLSRDALRATGGRILLMVRGIAYAMLACIALAPSMALLGMSATARWTSNLPPGFAWWSGGALGLLAIILYRILLVYSGDLLTAREQRILATLTREAA